MNVRRLTIALAALTVLGTAYAGAQTYEAPPVIISKQKIKVDGKSMYSHVVQEKQTVYSICKAYGISAQDLYDANEGLEAGGLKANSIILIPVDRCHPVQNTDKSQTAKAGAAESRSATKSSATAASTAAVATTATSEAASNAYMGIKSSDTDDDNIIYHDVKWYESIDDIAEKYSVSVEAIMAANSLTERKVASRQRLIIPLASSSPVTYNASGSGAEQAGQLPSYTPKSEVSIMMLLPLKLASRPTGDSNYMDFYCGALLACKDRSDAGVHVNLQTIDISNGFSEIRWDKADAVIGPVHSGEIKEAISISAGKAFFISPMDPKVEPLAFETANLIQAPTSSKTQIADLVSWISEEATYGDSVVVIREKAEKVKNIGPALDTLLKHKGVQWHEFRYNILEGRDIADSLERKLCFMGNSRVIIDSESEAFVSDVVRNLLLVGRKGYNSILYATSKMKSYETIDTEMLHKLNLRMCVSYDIDYSEPRVQKFVREYRALYHTEPNGFAFQGYDIVDYFSCVLSKYGDSWTSYLEKERVSLLQSDFHFIKLTSGGWLNCATQRLVYGDNYSIIKLDSK